MIILIFLRIFLRNCNKVYNCSSCVAENCALFLWKLLLLSKFPSFNLIDVNGIELTCEFKSEMQNYSAHCYS